VDRLDRPQEIEKGAAFVEVAGGEVRPVGELGVEIVMVVAAPGRESAFVGGPEPL
jgi:hypothetical protein